MTLRLGVLGSTRGSNLEPILAAIRAGELDAEVVVVISNRQQAGILQRAADHGLAYQFVSAKDLDRESYDCKVSQVLQDYSVDLVLMIGYMRIVSVWFCQQWQDRALNVHPSLLPKHAGLMDLDVHQAVLDAGDTESGCTVHYVTAEVDAGAIVVQKFCPVLLADTAETLKARVQPLEGQAWLEAIQLVIDY